jgi:hypothetical protein
VKHKNRRTIMKDVETAPQDEQPEDTVLEDLAQETPTPAKKEDVNAEFVRRQNE